MRKGSDTRSLSVTCPTFDSRGRSTDLMTARSQLRSRYNVFTNAILPRKLLALSSRLKITEPRPAFSISKCLFELRKPYKRCMMLAALLHNKCLGEQNRHRSANGRSIIATLAAYSDHFRSARKMQHFLHSFHRMPLSYESRRIQSMAQNWSTIIVLQKYFTQSPRIMKGGSLRST